MVLAYFGDEYSPDSLKRLANPNPNFAGTFYVDMISGLQKIGYHWETKGFALDHLGFERGLQAIRVEINARRPVLISTSSPPVGHTMIVSGYDDALQLVELMNPNWPAPGEGTMSYAKLERIWHDDFQHNDRWILITRPKND